MKCPDNYSNVNEENTPCSRCGSRVHYTNGDGVLRCCWCEEIIDEVIIIVYPTYQNQRNEIQKLGGL